MKEWAKRRRGEPKPEKSKKPEPAPPPPVEVWEWWSVEIRCTENGFTWMFKTKQEADEVRAYLVKPTETGVVDYGNDSFTQKHIVYVRVRGPFYRTKNGDYPPSRQETVIVPWDEARSSNG